MRKIRAELPPPQDILTRALGVSVALCITVVLVAQLFSFEKVPMIFSEVIEVNMLVAGVIASFIVVLELYSLPFLLGMALSKLMRVCSMVSGLAVLLFWLLVSIYTQLHSTVPINIGFLGTIPITNGWWIVSSMTVLLTMFVWYTIRSRSIQSKRP